MFSKKHWLQVAVLYGLISGLLLAIFFKFIEYMTHFKVYTLLLNIDYIPYINTFVFPEFVEVLFHLIVSCILALCLYSLFIYSKASSRKNIIYVSVLVCFIIGAALFPTTLLSVRTPAFTSIPSFSYWMIGHILYGYLLGLLFARYLIRD